MKSIRTKIILLVLLGSLLSAAVVGMLSIQNTKAQIQEDSVKLVNQAVVNSGQEIDAAISRIEQSVETLADCILNSLTDLQTFQTDTGYVDDFTKKMEEILLASAQNTEGAITAYLRYNPDFTEPTSGLFLSRTGEGVFDKLTPTDFSIYDKTDTAHVGWYYIPVENKKSTWMSPYLNENLQIYMVSYVVPLYVDGVSVGIVGMDIDFGEIQQIVDGTGIYRSGYAFLTSRENTVMYHKELAVDTKLGDLNTGGSLDGLLNALNAGSTGEKLASYKYNGTAKNMAFMELRNGMRLVLTAPQSEIHANENRLILLIAGSTAAAVVLSVVISLFIIRGIVKPLEELNRAAVEIAAGDLDVSVSCQSGDEIGTLADSIRRTVERLKQYILYIREISEVLEEIAGGNLVFKLQYDYAGEFSVIREALMNISHSLNHTLLEINGASEQVTNGSEQVSEWAQVLSRGTMEQASAVEELSAAAHEMADKVKRNAAGAEEAYRLAQEAESNVEESNQDMARMAIAIQRIAEASEQIGQIVKTVEKIAAQTNILALNAAVESARAGEAGKGFAVVAGEVRSLATQVNDATRNIARMVQDVSAAVGSGTAIAGKTEESLKAVAEKSAVIETKLQEIAETSRWQAAAMEQVEEEIGQISAVVQTNSATAQEGAAASEEMSSQAQLLRRLIRQFKLEGRDRE